MLSTPRTDGPKATTLPLPLAGPPDTLGEGAERALEAEVAELEERWCELTERIGCRRIG
jgi:hypothetical protein